MHSGAWLDDESWQERIIDAVHQEHIRAVIFDPARSVTAAVDKGPSNLQPLARFLRRLMRESGCTVILVHHDTKPLVGQTDTRKRAYRASGGGLVSIADSPIHAERLGDDAAVLLHPNLWKFSATPPALEVRLSVADDIAVLVATPAAGADATTRVLHLEILDYLNASPDRSGSDIARAVKAAKAVVLQALDEMQRRDGWTVDPDRNGPPCGSR